MSWFEILGPSGIGKTFLKDRILRNLPNKKCFSLEESLRYLVMNRNLPGISQLYFPFLKIYLSQNFINKNKNILVDLFLNYQKSYFEHSKNYEYLLQNCLNYYNELEIGADEKVYRITLFKSIIEKLTILDFHNFDYKVLLDEGPFNHSHQLEIKLINNNSRLPDGFIFCNASTEVIYERVKKRARDGRLVRAHKNLTDEELFNHIKKRNQDYHDRQKSFIRTNVPYIELDLNGNIDDASKKAVNFLLQN